MKRWSIGAWICFLILGLSSLPAQAMGRHHRSLGERALMMAMERLSTAPYKEGLVMVTNAGYVEHEGESTGEILDTVTRMSNMSRGAGTLLSVHARFSDPLFMTFVHKTGPEELSAVYMTADGDQITCSEVFNLWVGPGTSFDSFKEIIGAKTFAIVTLANSVYDEIPKSLIQAALFHDHFCCGVASGYFTTKCILDERPLEEGQSYTYIGVPSWCQDDYITHYLNLTPGKKGYLSMIYPNGRAWKSHGKTWENLGGIIIRFDKKEGVGDASVLSYGWEKDAFIDSLGYDAESFDWGANPWIHACYNRYLFEDGQSSASFVSIAKTISLDSKADFDRLTRMGANPLAEILGKDKKWAKEGKALKGHLSQGEAL